MSFSRGNPQSSFADNFHGKKPMCAGLHVFFHNCCKRTFHLVHCFPLFMGVYPKSLSGCTIRRAAGAVSDHTFAVPQVAAFSTHSP